MVELMAKIHDLMELKQLDTEWVIETNHGIVSGTSMSIKMERGLQRKFH